MLNLKISRDYVLFLQVVDTPQDLMFLSILQHLLRIDPKEAISDIIWDTAERLVHRSSLMEDADDSARLLRAPSHKSLTKLKVYKRTIQKLSNTRVKQFYLTITRDRNS